MCDILSSFFCTSRQQQWTQWTVLWGVFSSAKCLPIQQSVSPETTIASSGSPLARSPRDWPPQERAAMCSLSKVSWKWEKAERKLKLPSCWSGQNQDGEGISLSVNGKQVMLPAKIDAGNFIFEIFGIFWTVIGDSKHKDIARIVNAFQCYS